MAEPSLLIFVHIPKTGGSTMREILYRQYGKERCFWTVWGPDMPPVPHLVLTSEIPYLTRRVRERIQPGSKWYPEPLPQAAARFGRLPAERRAQIRVIRGHVPFGLGQYLPRPTTYFTLLRDPVDLLLSSYYYSTTARPPVSHLHEHIAARFESNPQTWILAGPHDDGVSLPPAEMLARARRSLRTCAVVGLTERFDETLLLLRRAFGWRWPFYVRRNVNRKRPPRSAIPAEVVRRIEADHALDVALYQDAQTLFEAQVRAYGPAFARDLRTFRALNFAWQQGRRCKGLSRRALKALVPGLSAALPQAGP